MHTQYLRTAQAGVDPFSFTDALVGGGHVVEAGVQMEHEEEIADGANNSSSGVKFMLVASLSFSFANKC